MPSKETIKQIALRNYRECDMDQHMFVRLCADDFKELKFGIITIELMIRLALVLFQYWLTNGVNDKTPEEFDRLYARARW
jgi:hypothetical protein